MEGKAKHKIYPVYLQKHQTYILQLQPSHLAHNNLHPKKKSSSYLIPL